MKHKHSLITALLIVLLVGAVGTAQATEQTGTVELSSDGPVIEANHEYGIGPDEQVSNLSVTFTGSTTTRRDSASGSLSSCASESVSVTSDAPPDDAEITLSAPYEKRTRSKSGTLDGSGTISFTPEATDSTGEATINFKGYKDTTEKYSGTGYEWNPTYFARPGYKVEWIKLAAGNSNSNNYVDLEIDSGDGTFEQVARARAGDSQYSDHLITDTATYQMDRIVSSDERWQANPSRQLYVALFWVKVKYTTPDTITVEGNPSISPTGSVDISTKPGRTEKISVSGLNGQKLEYEVTWTETDGVSDVSGSVGSTPITTNGMLKHPITRSVNLADGQNPVVFAFDGKNNGLNYSASWTETTKTTNPKIKLNGHTKTYDGKLADGETATLDLPERWLNPGETNNVTITSEQPADGPPSRVSYTFRHDQTGPPYSASRTSSTWRGSATVTTTYNTSQQGVTLAVSLPDNALDVRNVEIRRNDGPWQSATWSRADGSLAVDVGAVSAGDRVSVRASWRKIKVRDGSITITEPTIQGNKLATSFRVDSAGPNFAINVGSTTWGSRLHVLKSSSWPSEEKSKFGATQWLGRIRAHRRL